MPGGVGEGDINKIKFSTGEKEILVMKVLMNQDGKVKLDQTDTISVNLEERIDNDVVCRRFFSSHTANTLPRKLWPNNSHFEIPVLLD
jgi:hypothetical protein